MRSSSKTPISCIKMGLLLSPAIPSDFKRLFQCQTAAFGNDPFLDIIYPASTIDENVVRQITLLESDKGSIYLKVTDTQSGLIIAGAIWQVCNDDEKQHANVDVDWYGAEGGEDRAYAQYLFDEVLQRRRKQMPGRHMRKFAFNESTQLV